MGWTRWTGWGLLAVAGVAAAVGGTPQDAQAGKPSGGEGTAGPAGTIVFKRDPATSVPYSVWTTDTAGTGAAIPDAGLDHLAGVAGSRHGGKIWFFQWRNVAGPILIGNMRRELFAICEDGRQVQLTNDPYFVSGPTCRPEVLPGDTGLSVAGCRWEYVGGVPTVTESGHYTAPLAWDAADGVAPQTLSFTLRASWPHVVNSAGNPRVAGGHSAEYSADGRRAVFGGDGRVVWVIDLSTPTSPRTTSFAASDGPRLSPDGNQIVYRWWIEDGTTATPAGIAIRRLDGSAPVTITKVGGDANPTWSPDAQNVAFVRSQYSKGRQTWSLRWAPAVSGATPKQIGSYSDPWVAVRWIP
jgi:hypothetical protein